MVELDKVREILCDIVADDKRAAAVISGLRALIKKGETEFVPLDLNEIVGAVAWLMRSDTIMRNVSMSLELASDLPKACGDRVQLQQVVLNLVLNGLEAMREPHEGARTLVIRTARDGAAALRVTVQDSGPGIAEKDLAHIFEPLYTTKAEGLGMGLAIVRTIVNAHGGAVGAENNPEGGASLRFTLPVNREGDAMSESAPLVLVVDDDPSVRKSLTRLLASADYMVEAFASAQEFLAREPHEGPCCLVLDVRMPGLTGIQLQETLAATGRRMSIVFVTGHADVPTSVKAMKAGAVDLLTKPVDVKDLIAAIQRAVTQGRARADRRDPPRGDPAARGPADHARGRGVRPRRDRHAEQADRRGARHRREDGQGPPRAGHGEDAGRLGRRAGPAGRRGRGHRPRR